MSSQPRSILRAVALVTAATLGSLAAVAAQEPAFSTTGPATASERRLRDAVVAQYRVLPIQNGIVLVPVSRIDGVDNIELRDGTIAINGRPVTGGEVRERLGRGADTVLELTYLGLPAQRRILLPTTAGQTTREASPRVPPVGLPPGVQEPPAAPPEPPEPAVPMFPERTFEREVEARVRVGGNVTVAEDERVTGPVVAVAGSITVNGRVQQDVVAVGGNVHLGRRAEVRGDVVVVGGTVDRDPGAIVHGKVSEVAFSIPGVRIRPGWDFQAFPWFDSGQWRAVRLFASLLRMALFALLAVLVVLLAPPAVGRVQHAITTQPWRAALVGLLAQLFFVPVIVLVIVVLAVSIIGIPLLLLVPFGILAFFVALLLGFTGAATGLARLVQPRLPWAGPRGFAALVVGLAMIWGITVLGRIVGLGGGPLAVIGAALVFAGFVIEYAAWTVGLGGALLTRFGRHGDLPATVPPAPPTSGDPYAEDAASPLPPA
jgi:hypothetical protein